VRLDWDGGYLTLRIATPDDASAVRQILERASAWLRTRGIEQWPERFSLDWIGPALARGETWLANCDARTAGTLTISLADPAWPEDTDDACYVHRLAVERHAAGLGSALLNWAGEHAAALERRFLRLDCVASNERLRHYYESAGFAWRGDVEVGGPPGHRSDSRPLTVVSRYERGLVG
jgi:GNAT superfamily N-acetyltransferase